MGTILKEKYILDAKFKSLDEFLDIYKYPFLVEYEDPSEKNNLFISATITAPNLQALINNEKEAAQASKDINNAYPVVKTTRNPYLGQITIGRSSIQDIIIKDNCISKFQAYLGKDEEGKYFIFDNNSTNGTYLNGKRIQSEQRYPLSVGDTISIASYKFTWYLPEDAYHIFSTSQD